MFVRKQTVKGITYLSLVENRWNPAKRKHFQVKITALGKDTDPAAVQRALTISQSLNRFCRNNGIGTLADDAITIDLSDETVCSAAFDWGIREAAVHILARLGFLALPGTVAWAVYGQPFPSLSFCCNHYHDCPPADGSL